MPVLGSISDVLGPWSSTGVAFLSLMLVVCDGWVRRRHRMRVWVAAPERLLEQPSLAGWLIWVATPIALFAVGSAVSRGHSAAAPFTAWLAALSLLGAGHLSGLAPLGAAGLLLASLGLAAVPRAWFGVQDGSAAIGLSIAALWLLWLAHFWVQQLADGKAWTTTGRLIPAARASAVLLAAGMLILAVKYRLTDEAPPQGSQGSIAFGYGLQLLLVLAFWRRAILDDSVACAIGGSLAITSVALAGWVTGADTPLFLLALIAAAAVFLSAWRGIGDGVRMVLRPFVFLWIPCIGVLLALSGPWSGNAALGLCLIGVAALAGVRTLAPASAFESA
jgi:hypothetical protein